VLFGTPTRYGNLSSQLKQFLDTLGPQWAQGLLADKVYAGFTASMTAHGGQESTLLALYNTIHHFGGIVVAPGYTDPLKFVDGNPYGVSHVTGGNNSDPLTDVQFAALDHLAARVVRVAGKLKAST
jgi:NAD(P)H dehydrogenase (quinone)